MTITKQDFAAHDLSNTFAEPPALQILNTVPLVDGELVDSLQSDNDVLQWLAQAGWPVAKDLSSLRPSTLLSSARKLRETIRTLIERRKAEKRPDVSALNEFLSKSRSYLELATDKNGSTHLTRRWKRRTPEEVLAPLAEAAAEFLATANFDLVRLGQRAIARDWRAVDEGCHNAALVFDVVDVVFSHNARLHFADQYPLDDDVATCALADRATLVELKGPNRRVTRVYLKIEHGVLCDTSQ